MTVLPIGIPSTPEWMRNTGCIIAKPGKIICYLGEPIGVRLSRMQVQDYCLDQVCKRISNWKSKHLSFPARVLLIKQILMAILVYHQMYIHFSKEVANKLQINAYVRTSSGDIPTQEKGKPL